MKIAKFIQEVTVNDPDTNSPVQVAMYKHPNGGIFGVDASYLDQVHDDDSYPVIPDPMGDEFSRENIVLAD